MKVIIGVTPDTHDGKPYTRGDTLTVPETLAAEWESSGWVKRVVSRNAKG